MEVNQIIANLFQDKRVNECISKLAPKGEGDDIKQDTFLVLLSKDPSLIIGLHERGELMYYTVSIIRNISITAKRKRSGLHQTTGYIENDTGTAWHAKVINEPQDKPTTEDYIAALDNIPYDYYFKGVIEAVAKHGSQHKAAKAVRIPVSSLRRDVMMVREYLKRKVC